MEKIRCAQAYPGTTWRQYTPTTLYPIPTSVLCGRGASAWWDLKDACEIDVLVTRKETPSSYAAWTDSNGTLRIYDTSVNRWRRVEVFGWVSRSLESIGATSKDTHGYLGVNIIKWRS